MSIKDVLSSGQRCTKVPEHDVDSNRLNKNVIYKF